MLYLVFLNISCYIAEILINFLIVTYASLSSFSLEMSPLLSIYLSLFHHYLYLCPSFNIISISVPLLILSLTLSLFQDYLLFCISLIIISSSAYLSILYLTRLSFNIISNSVYLSSLSPFLDFFSFLSLFYYLYLCIYFNIISSIVCLSSLSLALSLFLYYL